MKRSVMTTMVLAASLVGLTRSADAAQCRSSTIPVQLGLTLPIPLPASNQSRPASPSGALATEQVFVRMCLPDGGTPSTVLLLVHGATYDHRYWDIADPTGGTDRYSFVASATEAGYATLAIDRIGSGQSGRPLSVLVDINQNASVVHQVVQALRAGTISGPGGAVGFPKVVLVGHSYGSGTSWLEATNFNDVDGLIITGALHDYRLVNLPFILLLNLYPALLDPKFFLFSLDAGYQTTLPGQRYDAFYAPSTDVDPAVLAQDEEDKDTVTETELASILVLLELQLDIQVPVLVVMGELDAYFCSQGPGDLGADCSSPASVVAGEASWYGPDVPCVDAFVTPGAGHDLNAFFSSQTTFNAAIDWLDDVITPGPGTPGC